MANSPRALTEASIPNEPERVTPDRRGTPYRIAGTDVSERSPDLEELLRSRLRIASALGSATAMVLGIATLASLRARMGAEPWLAITSPPFGLPMVLMALGMGWHWHSLAARRRPSLERLRRSTTVLLVVWAAYFVIVVAGDLKGLLAELAVVPIDLAMAHSSMWGLLLVATGVFLPSTRETGTRRLVALACCAFIPDVVVFLPLPTLPENALVYVVTKSVMVGLYAAFAAYGGHRIEALRRDAQAARQLGQYVLQRPLGSGGMGEVFLAEHRLLRRPCAVKLIHEAQAGDAATLRRFEREAQATATLTHPSTVQVFDYGIADDRTFYYVMEYLDGETLDALLRREGAQSPERVVHILQQLCGALQEAHERGLVHRDLKPANVMLCTRGGIPDVAKLLDFGLVGPVRLAAGAPATPAAAVSGDGEGTTASGELAGTPAYMSPEQCGGDSTIGPESDIYSLGALTFALLTGRSPFADRGPMQMVMAHLLEDAPRADTVNPMVPSRMADVVAEALRKAPTERPRTATAFGGALATSLA